jgi:hypothetical protein
MGDNKPDLVSIIVGFLIGLLVGMLLNVPHIYDEATANNAAHWTIDPETGERTFVWGPKPKEDRDGR